MKKYQVGEPMKAALRSHHSSAKPRATKTEMTATTAAMAQIALQLRASRLEVVA